MAGAGLCTSTFESMVENLRGRLSLNLSGSPYLNAQEATQTGISLMRAMLVEFPDDPTCHYLDRQYMLGESLLVAPVFNAEGQVSYYLPEGRWTNFFTGDIVDGAGWQAETHDFMSLPLLVRPNSVIPLGNQADRPDYDYGAGVTLQVYALEKGRQVTVNIPTLSGATDVGFFVRREGNRIEVERQGSPKTWQLLLVGVQAVAAVQGGTTSSDPTGTLIVPSGINERLLIELNPD